VPPLLKSLSARGRILIKSLVRLSKSERFYGLGTGLHGYRQEITARYCTYVYTLTYCKRI